MPFFNDTANGRVASDKVIKVKDAVQFDPKMLKKFSEFPPDDFCNPIKMNVKILQLLKSGVRLEDKAVYDMQIIIACFLVTGKSRNVDSLLFSNISCSLCLY